MKHSRNLVEQALDQYDKTAKQTGMSVDEASFVAGFVACFGIVTGKVPLGLPADTTILQLFGTVEKNLHEFHAQALRRHQEGFNGR